MDAFKSVEIERMRLGGNEGWRKFYEQHESTGGSIRWDEGTDADRYTSDVGEEWKERLTCKVEGKEYVPSEKKPAPLKPTSSFKQQQRSGTPLSGTASRSHSPGQGGGAGAGPGGKVRVDDQYFAQLGANNASRPDNLPPSQGGKYGGFGNTPGPAGQGQANMMSFDDVQKDPMAALTKGFGWFTTTVSKTAKNVNDGFIQPAAKNVCTSLPSLRQHGLLVAWHNMNNAANSLHHSLEIQTLPSKLSSQQHNWRSRPSRQESQRQMASTVSWRAMRHREAQGWMRIAGASGTTSPIWRIRNSNPTVQLGRAPWGWARGVRLRLHNPRSRTMRGMTGKLVGGYRRRVVFKGRKGEEKGDMREGLERTQTREEVWGRIGQNSGSWSLRRAFIRDTRALAHIERFHLKEAQCFRCGAI